MSDIPDYIMLMFSDVAEASGSFSTIPKNELEPDHSKVNNSWALTMQEVVPEESKSEKALSVLSNTIQFIKSKINLPGEAYQWYLLFCSFHFI